MASIPLFIYAPAVESLQEAIPSLAKGGLFRLRPLTWESTELAQLLEARPCVCVFSIFGTMPTAWLLELLEKLQALRQSQGGVLRDPTLRIVLVTQDRQIPMAVWSKVGVHEIIMAPIYANSLTFKISNHYHKAVAAERRRQQLAVLKTTEFEEKASPKIDWRSFESTDASGQVDDGTTEVTEYVEVEVVLDQVKPNEGRWERKDSESNPAESGGSWEWKSKLDSAGTSANVIPWQFKGEEPKFNAETKACILSGEKPELIVASQSAGALPEVVIKSERKESGRIEVQVKTGIPVKSVKLALVAKQKPEAASEVDPAGEDSGASDKAQAAGSEVASKKEAKAKAAEVRVESDPKPSKPARPPVPRYEQVIRELAEKAKTALATPAAALKAAARAKIPEEEKKPRATPESRESPASPVSREARERALPTEKESLKKPPESVKPASNAASAASAPKSVPQREPAPSRPAAELPPVAKDKVTAAERASVREASEIKTKNESKDRVKVPAKDPKAAAVQLEKIQVARLAKEGKDLEKVKVARDQRAEKQAGVAVKGRESAAVEPPVSPASPVSNEEREKPVAGANLVSAKTQEAVKKQAAEQPEGSFSDRRLEGKPEALTPLNQGNLEDDDRGAWSAHESDDEDQVSPEARRLRRALRTLGAKARLRVGQKARLPGESEVTLKAGKEKPASSRPGSKKPAESASEVGAQNGATAHGLPDPEEDQPRRFLQLIWDAVRRIFRPK